MPEQIPNGVSLITVFLVSIITMGVGLIGKILWDWLKNRRDEKKEPEKMSLKEIQEYALAHQSDETKKLREQIVKFETNDMLHFDLRLKELKESVDGLWKETNGIKRDMANLQSDISFIRGKMNGVLK